ncbi:hypothetical protein [Pseudescherichia sp.]|uniref:hypothetical protein n=1 Tax=Pseudescherichia sp. TaxID=2055881 RepID=UPI00289A91C8|nr:hypothetical protein [Pseudescherichia sp.]
MSWDNVTSVASAKIWTDNPDTTQAYLFANGNHQVKLTVRLIFNVVDANQPGPTQDECKAALSLVDYQTGADLSFLKVGDKGEYTYVYQENRPAEVKPLPDADEETVTLPHSGSYEFDLYVSSDSTINANYASESVAMFISFIDASGTEITYNSTANGKPSYVSVKVYPPKKYGMSGSNMVPIILNTIDDNATFSEISHNGVVTHRYDPSAMIYGLKINDGYFRLKNYQAPNVVVSPYAFMQHIIVDDDNEPGYYYTVAHCFMPNQNKLGGVALEYNCDVAFVTKNNYFLIEYAVKVHQQPSQLIFIRFYCRIMYTDSNNDGPMANSSNPVKLVVFDQFGNSADIEIGNDGDGYLKITSVV